MWHKLVEYFQIIISDKNILQTGGLSVLLLVIFAETGLFVGFFLPGDYMLALAGIYAATGKFDWPLYILLPSMMGAAWLGNTVGYYTGWYMGPRLFKKEDSIFFKRKYLLQTKNFYDHYGASMLILGRFLPYIRTFAPIMAGAIKMSFAKFNLFNMIGAFLWVGSIVGAGYIAAKLFPDIQDHADFIIYGFLGLTTVGLVSGYIRTRRKKSNES